MKSVCLLSLYIEAKLNKIIEELQKKCKPIIVESPVIVKPKEEVKAVPFEEKDGLITKISIDYLHYYNIADLNATVAKLQERYGEKDLKGETIINAYNKALNGSGAGILIYLFIL